jgi:hypothetical protein
LGVGALEVVGEAEHRGEFLAGPRIEVGIAAAGVDRIVADAEIGKAGRIVTADMVVVATPATPPGDDDAADRGGIVPITGTNSRYLALITRWTEPGFRQFIWTGRRF